jgi:hypothetical protein
MRHRIQFATLIALLAATALAGFARREETIEELKARVESARPEERPGLCTEIARRQVESADELYTQGKVEAALASVRDAVSYSEKAAEAALQSGKKLKHTEIALRKTAHRLEDIKHALSFEDQAPVQAAHDRLEQLRTQLLNRMFGKEAKD